MPVRNAVPYLTDCLHSILEQAYEDWELIAVDDHSDDQSWEQLQAFSAKDDRIRVVRNTGRGIIAALQLAYSLSTGSLIHRMDADDLMPPKKLLWLRSAWKAGSVVSGKVSYFSSDWLVGLGFQNYESWINRLMEDKSHWDEIYKECPIPSPAWLISREDLDRCGAFDSDLLPEDYDLCFRFYSKGLNVIGVKEIVHLWRDSQSRTSRKEPTYFPMAYYPLKLHYFLKLDRDNRQLVLWGAGKKGKKLAVMLMEWGVPFRWITNNERKVGVDIHGHVLEKVDAELLKQGQLIIAVASPDDQLQINNKLQTIGLKLAKDFWWFC